MEKDHNKCEEVQKQQPKTLWNINFIMVLVLGFLSGTANQMVNPILSKYAISLGATLTLAGTIVGLQSGMAMFLRPVSGASSDLLNRKYVMMGSGLITAAAYAGYLLFNSITSVMLCRILQGISFSFMSVARTAYATEYMPKEKMGEGIALTAFGVVLSQAVGPSIGLWVAESWGYNSCFILALIFSLMGSALLSTQPYKYKKGTFSLSKIKLENLLAVEIIPYAFVAGLFSIIIPLGNTFVALIGDERGIANVGLFFTMYSVFSLIIRPISGRALDKFGLDVLIYPAFLFAAVSMVLIGGASCVIFILLAGVTKALSQGVAIPSIQGASIKRLGKERAGVVAATIHMGQDFLNTLAPPVGGFLAARVGYARMFYIFAAAVLVAGIPLYTFLRHKDKKHEIEA